MFDLSSVPLIAIMSVIAVAAALVVFIGWGWPWLKHKVQGYPNEEEIERVLEPYILQAIMVAYRVSELALDEVGQRMRGADKAKIANTLYDLLPSSIGGISVAIIKLIISRERFAEFVQYAFDKFDKFYVEEHEHFEDLLKDWINANIGDGPERLYVDE